VVFDLLFQNGRYLRRILIKLEQMMTVLTDLQAAVEAEDAQIDKAIALLDGLKTALDAAIASLPDPAALKALSADIGARTQALADAVTRDTPATPAP
jgi:hypothetical protein